MSRRARLALVLPCLAWAAVLTPRLSRAARAAFWRPLTADTPKEH